MARENLAQRFRKTAGIAALVAIPACITGCSTQVQDQVATEGRFNAPAVSYVITDRDVPNNADTYVIQLNDSTGAIVAKIEIPKYGIESFPAVRDYPLEFTIMDAQEGKLSRKGYTFTYERNGWKRDLEDN
jgi:hypothetical protein